MMPFCSSSWPRRALPSSAALLLLFLAGRAVADSSSGGEEYLTTDEATEPNVIFLIDRSADMDDPCPVAPDCYLDEADTIPCPATTDPCIDDVTDAIGQVMQHYDWVRYGLVGTQDDANDDTFYPIVPLGSSGTDLASGLSSLTTSSDDTRNLAEALADLADDYFTNTTSTSSDPWNNAPIEYSCQENHVVIITSQRPNYDDSPNSGWVGSLTSPDLDVMCTWDSDTTYTGGPDEQCLLDNVARAVWGSDLRSDLDDTQNIVVHILLIGQSSTSVANTLFGNTHDVQDGEGYWTILGSSDFLLTGIAATLGDIRAGVHSRSTPVLSASGDYLLYSYYEIDGSNPLGEGHLRAYTINSDPADGDYGQIEMYPEDEDHPEEFEGAYWDAGWLLASRPVESGETQPNDMNGDDARDIYTFVDELADAPSFGTISVNDRRMTFDDLFVDAVASDESTYLPNFLDTTDILYNLDDSTDLVVDSDDLQVLVDFLRGYEHSTFRYSDIERGRWKLGDAPHSTPVVVEPRNDAFSVDPTYRTFLETLENDSSVPSMVYMAANDGMLHAFYLEDNISSSHTEEGEEAWAWIPSYTLYWDHESLFGITWPGRMIDQMLYGRTFLMDGTPVVEDVWLDGTGTYDGVRECDEDHITGVSSLATYCEWHRVLVVQQGQGGPSTLALDITDPLEPRYLWEQIDLWDTYATGYTVGRPVIAKVYDDRDSSSPTFRWVAIWGSGRAVSSGSSVDYYQRVEPNLYMWGLGDDYFGTFDPAGLSHSSATWSNSPLGLRMDGGGNNGHPEDDYTNTLMMAEGGVGFSDSDLHFEHGYIAATPAVVDADNDGDADVVYFPVTTTYGSLSDSPTPQPYLAPETQTSSVDYKDPGDTWIWKALVNIGDGTSGMDVDIDWCPTAFFDMDSILDTLPGVSRTRPPVYYAITSSWMTDGSLGLYWGTGSPYERYTGDNGYFFAVKDENPLICSTAVGITCDGQTGFYELHEGEGLTADPIVWSGVVFFSTYTPNSTDRCSPGVGRVYGLWFEDCSPAVDWGDGMGEADSTEVEGYPSQVAISDEGTIFIGTSAYDEYDQGIKTVTLTSDPLMATQTLSWMEVF